MSNYLYILIALIHPFSEFRVSVTQPRFTLRVPYFFSEMPVSRMTCLPSAQLMTRQILTSSDHADADLGRFASVDPGLWGWLHPTGGLTGWDAVESSCQRKFKHEKLGSLLNSG